MNIINRVNGGNIIIGSEWRRWDLHVHTPCSFHHEFKISTDENKKYGKKERIDNLWEKYIDFLENVDPRVKVIGITDYFSLDGYKKVLNYQNDNRLQNFDLILPNIELRVDIKNYKFNHHVIFSNKLDPEEIEEYFLHYLSFLNYEGEEVKFSKKEVKKYGAKLLNDNPNICATPYQAGLGKIFVSLKEVNSVLMKRSIFDGKYMSIIVGKDWDSIHGRAESMKNKILKESHAVFSSNKNMREYLLGNKSSNVDVFKRKFGNLKPCIHGSDAHSFDKICQPDEDRFCWIKADPSFEGLKQIMCEPSGRVKIQTEIPENRKSLYTLKSVEIRNSVINPTLSIKEDNLHLNRDLVVVTGGRGSGKTALLDLIANCFEDRCKRGNDKNEDKNSFVQRIEEYKSGLEVEIGFMDDGTENFSKKFDEKKFFKDSRIMYLPQGRIATYSGDKDKLSDLIKEIISKNRNVVKKGCNLKYKELEDELKRVFGYIESFNQTIHQNEKKVEDDLIEETENKLSIKKGELRDKIDEIEQFKEKMEGETAENIDDLKEKQKDLNIKHSKLEILKKELMDFEDNLKENCHKTNDKLENLNDDLVKLNINIQIHELNFQDQLEQISDIKSLLPEKIDNVLTNVCKVEDDLKQVSGDAEIQSKLIEESQRIEEEINILKKDLNQLNDIKKSIIDLELKRSKEYFSFLKKYQNLHEYYKKVINIFSIGESKDKILKEVEFKPKLHFNATSFKNKGYKLLNRRNVSNDEIDKFSENLEGIISQQIDENRLDNWINHIIKTKQYLKKSHDSYEFYEWVFGDYFSLKTDVIFNGTPINKLSMGQKGTVLLKLFLAEGDYPLIIDQPDDNLDNKFVYDELNEAFREAKTKRQIIIATNNANLVVNTDAEQVIIAEYQNYEINYIKGSLENPIIHKNIINVLEGGREAFEQREKKYFLNKSVDFDNLSIQSES